MDSNRNNLSNRNTSWSEECDIKLWHSREFQKVSLTVNSLITSLKSKANFQIKEEIKEEEIDEENENRKIAIDFIGKFALVFVYTEKCCTSTK